MKTKEIADEVQKQKKERAHKKMTKYFNAVC